LSGRDENFSRVERPGATRHHHFSRPGSQQRGPLEDPY
jgi:hypothetical protein